MVAAPDRVVPTWELADRLRKIRRDVMHAQQHDMADALGVGRQGYAAWEAGRTQPRDIVALAKRLELLCGVPASWTLGIGEAAPAVATRPSRANAEKSSFYSRPGQHVAPPMGAGPTAECAQGCDVRRKAA